MIFISTSEDDFIMFLMFNTMIDTYFLRVFSYGIQHKILLRLNKTWGGVIEVIANNLPKLFIW